MKIIAVAFAVLLSSVLISALLPLWVMAGMQ